MRGTGSQTGRSGQPHPEEAGRGGRRGGEGRVERRGEEGEEVS